MSVTALPVKARRARTPNQNQKSRFLGNLQIHCDRILANPLNPRKSYHFSEDNPLIGRMADSLAITSQHNPIKVYELVDQPGWYRLVQGHRRWYAAKLAGILTLECTVIEPPTNMAEELDWLGSDDALKEEWGVYSQMEYARALAQAYGYPSLNTSQVIHKTGLTAAQLIKAEKMFKLHPSIVAHVKRWEEYQYQKRLAEEAPLAGDFSSESGIKVTDFSPDRAALTWDLFQSMRTHAADTCRDYSDEALQVRLAQLASKDSMKDLYRVKAVIDSISRSTAPGTLSQVVDLLRSPNHGRSFRHLVRGTKNTYLAKMIEGTRTINRCGDLCATLSRNVDQTGVDLVALNECNIALLTMLRVAERFQASLDKRIKAIEAQTRIQ